MVTTGYHVKHFIGGLRYRRALERENINGYRQRLAAGRIRSEATKVVISFMFLSCSVLAVSGNGSMIAPVLAGAAALMAIDTFIADRNTKKVLHEIEADLSKVTPMEGGRRPYDYAKRTEG